MDNDLLSSFLLTLKEVNNTLLELTKITAHNQLAVKLIGIGMFVGFGSFITWIFTHLDTLLNSANAGG